MAWVASISPQVTEHPQLKAIASYDNYYGESPHRLVEFQFTSQEDFEAFVALEDVRATDEALAEQARRFQAHIFQLCSDYAK